MDDIQHHQIAFTFADQAQTRPKEPEAPVHQDVVRNVRRVPRNALPDLKQAIRDSDLPSPKDDAQSATLCKQEQETVSVKLAQPPRRLRKPLNRTLQEVEPEVGASKEALAELEERNAVLTEELERLQDRVAVHFMEGTEEEKQAAADTIAQLRSTIGTLQVKLQAVTDSRDSLQTECNELRRQCGIYRRQLVKRARSE